MAGGFLAQRDNSSYLGREKMKKITIRIVDNKELTSMVETASEKSYEFELLVALQKKLMGRSWKGANRTK